MRESLTPREKQAAQIAATGRTNREVAAQMKICEGTVKQYLHRVYDKSGVDGRPQLLALCPRCLRGVCEC